MEHTIFGLIKKRGEIAGQHKVALKAADALKADLDAIDRALILCGYEDAFGARHETRCQLKTNPGEEIKPRLLHLSTTGNYST